MNFFLFINIAFDTDVYEESEADLASERHNNDNNSNRSTKSRSPDEYYVKVTKNDRKISSGYFYCFNFCSVLFYLFFFIIFIPILCSVLFYQHIYSHTSIIRTMAWLNWIWTFVNVFVIVCDCQNNLNLFVDCTKKKKKTKTTKKQQSIDGCTKINQKHIFYPNGLHLVLLVFRNICCILLVICKIVIAGMFCFFYFWKLHDFCIWNTKDGSTGSDFMEATGRRRSSGK